MSISDRELDALLSAADPLPPDDFAARVVTAAARERDASDARAPSRLRLVGDGAARRESRGWRARLGSTGRRIPSLLRWCLIGVGGVFGVAQSASFCLGLWFATVAA